MTVRNKQDCNFIRPITISILIVATFLIGTKTTFAQDESELDELEAELESEENQKAEAGSTVTSKQVDTTSIADARSSQKTEMPMQVQDISFLSSTNGGTVQIKTSGSIKYTTRKNVEANQFIVEMENANLPERLRRPYILKEFDGVFGAVDAYQNPGGTVARIVIQLKQDNEPVVTQEGNTLLVMPGSVAKSVDKGDANSADAAAAQAKAIADAKKEEDILGARTLDEFLTNTSKFYGAPISIETKETDIRDVIGFIAQESGLNLVLSDDVTGKITVKLREIPWDQALVIIMRSKGLGYLRQGSVLRITRLETLQAEAKTAKDIVDAQKNLTPLKVRVIPVSYATVADLQNQLAPFLTTGRGKVVSDSRTSSLIVTDTAEVLEKVERLVRELDIPPAQVMIEGKIVEAGEDFSRTLGVNWSLSGVDTTLSQTGGYEGSPISIRPDLRIQPVDQTSLRGAPGSLGFTLGTLDYIGSLSARLSLAQADNLVRIISSPRIVTMNKTDAEISQAGESISIQRSSDSSDSDANVTAQAVRSSLELKLKVTPQITNEGSVILDVDVKRQFPGAEADQITKARPINTRSAKTKVLVPNGQTAVIGGIYQSDETESTTGVPGLKDIPVLGWLFKSKSTTKTKNELLIFLTPRILNAKDQGVATE